MSQNENNIINWQLQGQNVETFSREMLGRDHGEWLVELLRKPLFFCFLCNLHLALENSINLTLHL